MCVPIRVEVEPVLGSVYERVATQRRSPASRSVRYDELRRSARRDEGVADVQRLVNVPGEMRQQAKRLTRPEKALPRSEDTNRLARGLDDVGWARAGNGERIGARLKRQVGVVIRVVSRVIEAEHR